MERILSVEQMRQADDYTINTLGFSRQELVNRAGAAVAEEIKKRFKGGRVLVCIGKGNNGADGRVVAEILSKTHGFTVASVSVFNGIFKLFDRKFDIIVDCVRGFVRYCKRTFRRYGACSRRGGQSKSYRGDTRVQTRSFFERRTRLFGRSGR